MLLPIITLILWTLFMLIWLYLKRIPAMQKAKINPDDYKLKGATNMLPSDARAVADNYNHLHESPTLFYALALVIHIANLTNQIFIILAWIYVALRIIHSLIQANQGRVIYRFSCFILSNIALGIMAIQAFINLLK